jgi:hypothetical protein
LPSAPNLKIEPPVLLCTETKRFNQGKPMPSNKAIVAYWSKREEEGELSVDWADAHERCWRCGSKANLTQCHIIPDSRGGTKEPSNIVLLCHLCHREAPNVVDPRFMWIWLHAYKASCYGDFWYDRAREEFERMFKRKPFSRSDETPISEDQITATLKCLKAVIPEVAEKAIIHFGEARLNPATLACIIYLIEEQVSKDKTFNYRLIQTILPFSFVSESTSQ